ncbi:MAG: hypothetical protein HY319_23260 [Armatimonadetes bacterium]|nr:hypothetical protein [Armatimonadota bacterium]
MAQYDVPIAVRGGFSSLSDAMAHRRVIQRLEDAVQTAASVAEDLRGEDKAELGATPTDLYTDLAPGLGHVIVLSQPEGQPLMGAELHYRPESGEVQTLSLDLGEAKIDQVGHTFKLQEDGATTFFQKDERRGVYTIMDPDQEVPALFQGADPQKLTAGTIQLGAPILIF